MIPSAKTRALTLLSDASCYTMIGVAQLYLFNVIIEVMPSILSNLLPGYSDASGVGLIAYNWCNLTGVVFCSFVKPRFSHIKAGIAMYLSAALLTISLFYMGNPSQVYYVWILASILCGLACGVIQTAEFAICSKFDGAVDKLNLGQSLGGLGGFVIALALPILIPIRTTDNLFHLKAFLVLGYVITLCGHALMLLVVEPMCAYEPIVDAENPKETMELESPDSMSDRDAALVALPYIAGMFILFVQTFALFPSTFPVRCSGNLTILFGAFKTFDVVGKYIAEKYAPQSSIWGPIALIGRFLINIACLLPLIYVGGVFDSMAYKVALICISAVTCSYFLCYYFGSALQAVPDNKKGTISTYLVLAIISGISCGSTAGGILTPRILARWAQ